jgi:phage portal protein BeeE
MSLWQDFTRALNQLTTPKKVEGASYQMGWNERGKVGKSNALLYRNWAEHSEWVRVAIDIRRRQVASAEWKVVPFDTDKPASQALIDQITNLFNMPNPKNDSFRKLVEEVLEDVLVLDAGCIENVRSLRGQIVELYPVDGATIKVNALWDGSNPDEYRYYWYPDWQERARLKNDDLIYIMANPRTYSVVGLSPLETLKLAIDAELSGNEYNRRQVTQASPDGIFDLGEGAKKEDVDKFASFWASEIAGKGALAFIGNTKGAKFIPFRGQGNSNRDMQFLEWQQYLTRKIAAVFGLAPQDFNLTADVNRSTAETQDQHTEDRGLRPLMQLVQEYLTREIVWDDGFGGPANNLAFRFTALNLKESKGKADINKLALAGMPWKTVDEARIDDGRAPLGGQFAQLMAMGPTGVVALDDIPTAQDVLDSKKPAPSMSAAPNSASRPSPKKSD